MSAVIEIPDTAAMIDGVETCARLMNSALDKCVDFLMEVQSQDAYVGLCRTLDRIQPGLTQALDKSLEAKGVDVTKMHGGTVRWVIAPII